MKQTRKRWDRKLLKCINLERVTKPWTAKSNIKAYKTAWWPQVLNWWVTFLKVLLYLYKANTRFHNNNTIAAVKHGDGNVIVWGCLAALATCHNWLNHEFCSLQKILLENVQPVFSLKLKSNWVMQQANYLKHKRMSTSEWLKRNKILILKWTSQSPDLSPIQMLWAGP